VLRASGHRTQDTGCIGWPTPMAGSKGTENYNPSGDTCNSRKTKILCGWSTPMTMKGRGGFQTNPAKAMERMKQGRTRNLDDQVTLYGWATPTVRDHKDGTSMGTVETNGLLGRQVWEYAEQTGKCGALNPAFSLWLMGFPTGWHSSGVRAMQSYRSSQPSLSKRRKKLDSSDLI